MKNNQFQIIRNTISFLILSFTFLISGALAQEQPPAPAAPKAVSIPAVKENKMVNGLTVAVVERRNVPLARNCKP